MYAPEPVDAAPVRAVRWSALLALVLAVIIVPFLLVGDSIEDWSVGLFEALSQRRTLTLLLVIALLASDVLLPIPSSIVSTLAGALLGLVWGALASLAGMTLGCLFGYGLGRTAGKSAASRLVGVREIKRLEESTRRHGDWSLVVFRAVPVLAEASTVFAGMGSMDLRRFIALTALSNLGISVAYATVGAYAVELESFLVAVGGAILVPLLAMTLHRRLQVRG